MVRPVNRLKYGYNAYLSIIKKAFKFLPKRIILIKKVYFMLNSMEISNNLTILSINSI